MRVLVFAVLTIAALAVSGAPQKKTPAKGTKVVAKVQQGSRFFVRVHNIPAPEASGNSCGGLLPATENRTVAADQVPNIMGDTQPFSFVARGSRRILIYSNHQPLSSEDSVALARIEGRIDELARLGTFQVQLTVPHALALGNISAAVSGLNASEFEVESAGPEAIRVSSETLPDCEDWRKFLTDLRTLAWRPKPVQPVEKVFYLDGASIATALNGTAASAAGSGDTGSAGAQADRSGGSDVSANVFDSAPAAPSQKAMSSSKNGLTKSSGNKTGGQKSGGKKSPGKTGANTNDPTATAAVPNTGSDASGADDAPDNAPTPKSTKADAKTPAKQVSSQPPPTTAGALSSLSDVVVFSQSTPGDDAAVDEKKRIVSMLDLPRPEMLVNVWSAQISAADPDLVRKSSTAFREAALHSNDLLQGAIGRGWNAIKGYFAGHPERFDGPFYQYISYRHVAEMRPRAQTPRAPFQVNVEDFLNYRTTAAMRPGIRARLGVCDADQYCLGYTELFHPIKPALMDLLLALIAADDPIKLKELGLREMEGEVPRLEGDTCEKQDRSAYNSDDGHGPVFRCFREKADLYLSKTGESPTPKGLLQSAVADFLFHYKMASEFPHDFSPYGLTQSAERLNAALAPLIDGFNRDIAIFQTATTNRVINPKIQRTSAADWTTSDRSRVKFENYGVVTVRTVSGKETIVDTATQNYLDVTKAPTIPELLNSISAAESKVPGVIGNNLSAAAAAAMIGALNTTQNTDSKIGRGLKIDIKPRSLRGASSAELEVVMNVEETAEPTLYTGGVQSNSSDNLSRVAKHDITTKIRVESLRIFEISSFSAKLLRSRARFPLLPLPGLEFPYIGTLVGIPRRPSSEYHSSVAVLSAIVVPTAADLAYGTRFERDSILGAEEGHSCPEGDDLQGCEFRSPRSMGDLNRIQPFHRAMVNCFSTAQPTAIHPVGTPVISDSCTHLTFSSMPQGAW